MYAQSCPDSAYDAFLSIFTSAYQDCFPCKTFKPKNSRKPWITPESLKLIKKKNALLKHYLNTRDKADLHAFKVFRNKVTGILRQTKKNYLHNLFNAETLRRSDIVWQRLNSVLGRGLQHTQDKQELNLNGTLTSGAPLANAFNNFFASLDKSAHDLHALDYMPARNCASAFLAPTNNDEVYRTFFSFRNSRARDADDIQIRPVKYTLDIICPVLVYVFNLSFSQGVFPKNMQLAKVSVIFKSGDLNCLSNYRPISILPVFSKGLEKLINDRMTSFCGKHNLITASQFGFRKGLSTECALLTQKEIILQAIENKLLTLGVFVDYSKAFDRLNHTTLLKKLEHYGFRGIFLDLLSSYLKFRCQKVIINGQMSDVMSMQCGVPQGSILGPLLFNMYINDLVGIDHSTKYVIYADDTTLLFCSNDATSLIVHANDVLNKLNKWSTFNSLTINTNKTKAVLFKPKNQTVSVNVGLTIGTSEVEIVTTFRSLGVIFDEHLLWNKHVDSLANTLSRTVGALTKLRFLLPTNIKLLIYNSLFLSHLNYCLLVWGNTTASNINKIHLLQKKAVRAICNSSYDAHTKPLFQKLGIRAAPDLYTYILTKRYNLGIKYNNTFITKLSNLTRNHPRYETRHNETWYIPHARTNYGTQMLSYALPLLLNSL